MQPVRLGGVEALGLFPAAGAGAGEGKVRILFACASRLLPREQDHDLVEYFLVTGVISLYLAVLTSAAYEPLTTWLQGLLGTQ